MNVNDVVMNGSQDGSPIELGNPNPKNCQPFAQNAKALIGIEYGEVMGEAVR